MLDNSTAKKNEFDLVTYFALISSLPEESFDRPIVEVISQHCKEAGSFEFFFALWPHSSLEEITLWFNECAEGKGAFKNFGHSPKDRMLKLLKMLQLYWDKYNRIPKNYWLQQQENWLVEKFGENATHQSFHQSINGFAHKYEKNKKQIWKKFFR